MDTEANSGKRIGSEGANVRMCLCCSTWRANSVVCLKVPVIIFCTLFPSHHVDPPYPYGQLFEHKAREVSC